MLRKPCASDWAGVKLADFDSLIEGIRTRTDGMLKIRLLPFKDCSVSLEKECMHGVLSSSYTCTVYVQ